jgi:predicted CXXCH cytochrome family protein
MMHWFRKIHVLRPLLVVMGVVAIIFIVRAVLVPSDFGIHQNGFTYGWYRQGNLQDWKNVTVKYQGKQSCAKCHQDKVDLINQGPHGIIQCENCHGPAGNHPSDPPKLPIDTSRELCKRCHALLPYPANPRNIIKGIDPNQHHPGSPCVTCHIPHDPIPRGAE